jgi:hypothetical protein
MTCQITGSLPNPFSAIQRPRRGMALPATIRPLPPSCSRAGSSHELLNRSSTRFLAKRRRSSSHGNRGASMCLPAFSSGRMRWMSFVGDLRATHLVSRTRLTANHRRYTILAVWRGFGPRGENPDYNWPERDHRSRRQDRRTLCFPRFNAVLTFILDLSMHACRLCRPQLCTRKYRAVCDRTKGPPSGDSSRLLC